MTFENTYLMLLYFKNKKKYKAKEKSTKTVSFNKDADKKMIDLENEIANYSLINNNNSNETIDNRRYLYNRKNIIIN